MKVPRAREKLRLPRIATTFALVFPHWIATPPDSPLKRGPTTTNSTRTSYCSQPPYTSMLLFKCLKSKRSIRRLLERPLKRRKIFNWLWKRIRIPFLIFSYARLLLFIIVLKILLSIISIIRLKLNIRLMFTSNSRSFRLLKK